MKLFFKIATITAFVIYILVMVYFLFLRDRYLGGFRDESFLEYVQAATNFVPFKTIGGFISRYSAGRLNGDVIVYNIVGNIIMFAPFGVFLPMIFEKSRKFCGL